MTKQAFINGVTLVREINISNNMTTAIVDVCLLIILTCIFFIICIGIKTQSPVIKLFVMTLCITMTSICFFYSDSIALHLFPDKADTKYEVTLTGNIDMDEFNRLYQIESVNEDTYLISIKE